MRERFQNPVFFALLAAILFGLSAPISKLLLAGVDPVPLASLLYLGAGIGTSILFSLPWVRNRAEAGAGRLSRSDIKWLAGAVLAGGVAAPVLFLSGLQQVPAATVSLLLNFEAVATALVAGLVFRESIGRRVWGAVLVITLAGAVLTWNTGSPGSFPVWALAVMGACVLWGVDSNLTRVISEKSPLAIAGLKGLSAGAITFLLALAGNSPFPDGTTIIVVIILGFFSYGLSTVFFVLALRGLGAARTSAFFGIAPFAGVVLSLILFNEPSGLLFWASLLLMALGALLLTSEIREKRGGV